MSKFISGTILSLFLFLSINLNAREIEHMRVIWQENPSHEAYIAWTTKGPIPTGRNRVYFDTVSRGGESGKYTMQKRAFLQKPYSYSFSMLHAVKLKDLKPNTTYYFVIRSGKDTTKEFHFKTAPKTESFELLFGGDSRSDRPMRREMNKIMKQMFQTNPNIYALVHGGDYIANGFSWKQWKAWMDDHQLTTTDEGRVLPIIPTRGNHELSRALFNDIFIYPGNIIRPNYYTTKIGDFSLINLNTNWVAGGPQKWWLKKELKKAAKNSKWIVTNYHRPAYPAVKKAGRAKKHWVPLFEDYQVDIVFESDGHTLKRTAPIYRDKVDFERGITYVGEGGLGVKQRIPKRKDEWYFQSPGYAVSAHHVMKLRVESEKMIYSVHTADLKLFDQMEIFPRNRK